MPCQIDIFTLFPAMFAPLEESIVKRAAEKAMARGECSQYPGLCPGTSIKSPMTALRGRPGYGDEAGADFCGGGSSPKGAFA